MPDYIKQCQSWTAVIHADFKHRAATGTFAVYARRPVWVSNHYLSCASDWVSKCFSPYIIRVTECLRWLGRGPCWLGEPQFWESGSQLFILHGSVWVTPLGAFVQWYSRHWHSAVQSAVCWTTATSGWVFRKKSCRNAISHQLVSLLGARCSQLGVVVQNGLGKKEENV